MRRSSAAIALLALLPAALAAAPASPPPGSTNAYRSLRDSVRAGRFKSVDLRTRVATVLGQGRYALDLSAAAFARSGIPNDYPVTLVAGGTRTTARFLSADQARLRDRYARDQGSDVQASTEVRLVVDDSIGAASTNAVVLDAWSGDLLFPLDLRPGDAVTITSSMPDLKGP